uniref:Molybdenum cofactor sulfurase n=1 Tax=Latimeria chalumnae TaxID=7897 RepID=H3AUI3_LATCH
MMFCILFSQYRILQHFNISPEEYTVIFTSGSTAAFKLVAESFAWTPTGPEEPGSRFFYLTDSHTSVVGIRGLTTLMKVPAVPIKPHEICKVGIGGEDGNLTALEDQIQDKTPHLFCYAAQSNFSGTKYPLLWIEDIRKRKLYPFNKTAGEWFVLLDAASYASTSPLNLALHQADFIPISFYKIFGFPTGLGALLVCNKSAHLLRKVYFGGGTAAAYLAGQDFFIPRQSVAERFEDGTVSFLDIIALKHGFDALERLTGGMQNIMLHTFGLAQSTYRILSALQHSNGSPVVCLYTDTEFDSPDTQGPIINFNVLDENGGIIGYSQVDKLASLYNIHLRTGCFCNTGACQQHLGISDEDIKKNLQAGHVCGDNIDLIDGRPTGSVRVSFGYMSTFEDAQTFLKFIVSSFAKSPARINRSVVSQVTAVATESPVQNVTSDSNGDPLLQQEDVLGGGSVLDNSSGPEKPFNLHQSQVDPERNNGDVITDGSLTKQSCTGKAVTLTNIYLYPIKSCTAFEVKQWPVGRQGLLYDRNWMVVNLNGVCLSQKQEPRLCLICPVIDLERGILIIKAEGVDPLTISLKEESMEQYQFCQSKVCGDRVKTYDCGKKAAHWLSMVLGRQCQLIRQSSDFNRDLKKKFAKGHGEMQSASLSLVNEAQYLLINRASIQHLCEQINMSEKASSTALMKTEELIQRFRANFVTSGTRQYEEDEWTEVTIGSFSFQVMGQCSRCQMICIDQETGKRSNEPLHTLSLHRGGKIPFGIYLLNRSLVFSSNPTVLTVGSSVFPRLGNNTEHQTSPGHEE